MYEERVLAYIDILGFSVAIDETIMDNDVENIGKTEEIRDLLDKVQEYFKDENNLIKVNHFSDTIVISCLKTDVGLLNILFNVLYLCLEVLEKGFLLRGSIVYGKLYHKEQKIFGPALVRAYEIEKKLAVFPRIILDGSILKPVNPILNPKKVTRANYKKIIHKITTKDFDGYYYIDYIDMIKADVLEAYDTIPKYFKSLTDLINEHKIIKDARIRSKYLWLEEKYNMVLAKYKMKDSMDKVVHEFLKSCGLLNIIQ